MDVAQSARALAPPKTEAPKAVDMAVAVAKVHLHNGFFSSKGGYEYPLTLLAACLALAFSAWLCMLFCGNEGLDGERKAIRHALIVENLQQLYTDIFNDWIVANEEAAEGLHWRAAAIDRYLKLRLRGSQGSLSGSIRIRIARAEEWPLL